MSLRDELVEQAKARPRLRRLQLTEEMVEAAAKVLYAQDVGIVLAALTDDEWSALPWSQKSSYRDRAGAVLNASLSVRWPGTPLKQAPIAPQGITDEMVEAAARATWEQAEGEKAELYGRPAGILTWELASLREKDVYLRRARAALEAAVTVTAVHLCDTCAQSKCWTRRDIEHACEDSQFPAKAVVVECAAYVPKKDVQEVAEGA